MALSTVGILRIGVAPPSTMKRQVAAPRPAAMTIECSSRPQKKATAHHRKTRPKKTQPWDVKRRGPTPYPPLPPLPADWTLVSSSSAEAEEEEEEEEQQQQQLVEEGAVVA